MTDITENGKYYEPELGEFFIGFAYQSSTNGGLTWQDTIVINGTQIDFIALMMQNSDQYKWRVKYLDHDDIVSCYWHHEVTSAGNAFFYYGDNTLNVNYAKHYIIITCCCDGNNVSLFQGRIQNKSELKRLMKQLGIEINQQS